MKKESLLLRKTIDPKRLYTSVKEVSSFHRIQASPSFRKAAKYCKKQFEKMGIETRILSYKAEKEKWYLENKSFQEWELKYAYLRIDEHDLLLADSDSEPISIIQKSYPYDFREGCELVYLEKGNDPEYYKDLDLKGKIIFVRDAFNDYLNWAIKEKGAIGIVTDYIRTIDGIRSRNDLYTSLNYTSFWWTHEEEEPHCFGFVLSPEMGDKLASLCVKKKEAYEKKECDSPYLVCSGRVKTDLYDGKFEVVEAKIPGTSEEEVLICAHLCHPKSSCNDNASGVAAAMEILRSIKYLIDLGKLEKNRRTIKVILVPEFTGTYAYLSEPKNYKYIVGAINLDMVGGKQDRRYGPITLSGLPYSTPSFINDLASLCLDYAGEETNNIEGESIPKTNYKDDLFANGSDHNMLCDPTINVPCCMLGQWPDVNYHTSTDTLDVIDPEVLAFSTHVGALFAYTLSNITRTDVKEIMYKSQENLAKRFSKVASRLAKEEIDTIKAMQYIDHIEEFYVESMYDLHRVITLEDNFIHPQVAFIKSYATKMKELLNLEKVYVPQLDTRVFKRDYIGPIENLRNSVLRYNKEAYPTYEKYEALYKNSEANAFSLEMLVQYYLNGKNSVSEIINKVSLDMNGEYKEIIVAYIELLETLKLVHKI